MARRRTRAVNPPAPPEDLPEPRHRSNGRRIYTVAETRLQERFVEAMLQQGFSEQDMYAAAMKPPGGDAGGLGVSRQRTRALILRTLEKWKNASAADREYNRAKVEQRILANIRKAKTDFEANPVAKHAALHRWESLLSDIQGTKAPVQVNVDVRVSQNITAVIANLTPEQVTTYMERHRRMKEMAEEYQRLHGKRLSVGSDQAAE